MDYLLKFIYFSVGQIYISLKIFLPFLYLISQIYYVYSLTPKKNSASLNSAFCNIFKHQEIKEELFVSFFPLWLFYCVYQLSNSK